MQVRAQAEASVDNEAPRSVNDHPRGKATMAHNIRFDKVVSGTAGRYLARIDGIDGEAEITFTLRGPALISADHTNAPESLRGTGAAAALVEHMIADARVNGFKIMPICPYVQAQYRRHPEWSDVMVASNSGDLKHD
jgi:predicted GNAT family acetyltransferase